MLAGNLSVILFPVQFNENLWHVCIIISMYHLATKLFSSLGFYHRLALDGRPITKITRHLIALATAVDLGIAILTL